MHEDEHDIIKGCKEGSRSHQRALYERYKSAMYAICLRYARCAADADDMFQEGFMKVYRDLHQYRTDAPLFFWMRRLMINTALEHLRRNKRNDEAERDNIRLLRIEAEEESQAAMSAQELRRRIAELPDDLRTVFNLHAIEGYGHSEIAEMLGISVANSKVRLNRARASLKRSITEMNKYYSL